MKSYRVFLLVVAALALAGCNEDRSPSAPSSAAGPPSTFEEAGGSMPFEEAQIFLEFNSTDNDAGIQVFVDGEPWKELEIVDRRGRELLEIEASGGMKKLGLTELRFEGAEPEPDEVLDAFPAGEYRFRGRAVERFRLTGSATLSHDMPPAPEFSPSDGEVVDPDNVVIEWTLLGGVDRYQVIVENDATGMSMEVTVSSSTSSLHVPPTFLEPNTEYKAEILAIAPNGNRTITESTFVTGP
ncbi:MAG: hypothetical protein L0Z51_09745 [Candidatus Latescibacteria bacterium]|nr:hypothetical protein [Candidatus Latescibacterota bacterium]